MDTNLTPQPIKRPFSVFIFIGLIIATLLAIPGFFIGMIFLLFNDTGEPIGTVIGLVLTLGSVLVAVAAPVLSVILLLINRERKQAAQRVQQQ